METELVDQVTPSNVKLKETHTNMVLVHYQWHMQEKTLVEANSLLPIPHNLT